MAWDKTDTSVVFECDDCDEAKVTCDINSVWATSTASKDDAQRTTAGRPSDFEVCWQYTRGIGWRSFKRIGHPWTFHCPKCGPAAEVAHREHQRMEANRDRLKHKNARD